VYIKLVVLLRNYVTMMHGQQNIKNGWATIVVVGRLRVNCEFVDCNKKVVTECLYNFDGQSKITTKQQWRWFNRLYDKYQLPRALSAKWFSREAGSVCRDKYLLHNQNTLQVTRSWMGWSMLSSWSGLSGLLCRLCWFVWLVGCL
jgi:hypothetical protein